MMNKNISFCIKCILAAIPALILVGFTALCPNCYMDEEYPAWRYTKEYVSQKGNDADVLILGDSRAMANLIPNVIMENADSEEASTEMDKTEDANKCVNIAVGGATPMEMYYFYSEYLQNNKAPRTAIVMFAPFHYMLMDNYKTRTLYFNALDGKSYRELLKVANRYNAESVLFEDQAAYHLSCALSLPDVYLPALYNARFVGRKNDNDKRLESLAQSKGQGYFGTLDGCNEKAYEATYPEMIKNGDADLLQFYARALFTMLSESCENVILVQPPMNEITYDNLNEKYVSEYRECINELCDGLDNFTYTVDFEKYDSSLFGDPSHLNEKGAVLYSEKFRDKYSSIMK